ARARTGDSIVYRVIRGGRTLDIPVRFESPLVNPMFVIALVVRCGVALVFLIIGILVFMRRSDDRRVLVFYALVMVGALSLIASPVLMLDGTNLRGIVAEQFFLPSL